MSTVVSVMVLAILFAAFGWVRPRAGCEGSCGNCPAGGCALREGNDEHE